MRPATGHADDSFPQPPVDEPHGLPHPVGFEELDYPEEIELRLPAGLQVRDALSWTVTQVQRQLHMAGWSSDQVEGTWAGWDEHVFTCRQGRGATYAGVPRGDTLTLRLL